MAGTVLVAVIAVGLSIILYLLWLKLERLSQRFSLDWTGLLRGRVISGNLRFPGLTLHFHQLQLRWDWQRIKLSWNLQQLKIEFSPKSSKDDEVDGDRVISFRWLGLLGKFVTLRSEEVVLTLEYRSPSFSAYSHLLPKLRLQAQNMRIFDEDGEGRTLPVQIERFDLFAEEEEIAHATEIGVRHKLRLYDSMEFLATSCSVKAEASWLLVLTTMAADHRSDSHRATRLMRDLEIIVRINQAQIDAAFPLTDSDRQRFSGASLRMQDLCYHAILPERLETIPRMVLTSSHASFLAISSASLSEASYTRFDGLMGRTGGDQEDVVMRGNEIVITNALEKDYCLEEALTPPQLTQLIKSIADGIPCFSAGGGQELPTVPPQRHSLLPYTRWSRLGYTELSKLHQEAFHFIGSATEYAFELPFEFPIGIFFDHLNFLSKAAQSPLKPEITPQTFSPFAHTWRLTLILGKASFSLQDDPFEMAIQRIHAAKKVKAPVFLEVEDWLNRHPPPEEKGSRPPVSTDFLAASQNPEYARAHPTMVAKLVEMHSLFLREYRQLLSRPATNRPLFSIEGEQVTWSVRWQHQETITGEAVLNGMDQGSSYYNGPLMSSLNTLLGGYWEFIANKFRVTVRDYALPMIDTSRLAIFGPLFFVEGKPSAEVVINWPLRVRGGIELEIPTCILPLAVHHCLNLIHAEEEPFKVGFSPRWEGAFLTIERAFDLFSRPSEERSPPLAVWDKMRVLFRGTWTRMTIRSPCLVYCLTDLIQRDDYGLLQFERGLDLAMKGAATLQWSFAQAKVMVNSTKLSLLLARLQQEGQSYFEWDRVEGGLCDPNEIPILHLPETRLKLSLSYWNIHGDAIPVDLRPKLVARVHDPSGKDSYREFRIHSTSLHLQLESHGPQDCLDQQSSWWISYYREIELWIEQQFMSLTLPTVRRGPLFASPFISSSRGQKVWKVLSEVHLSLDFAVALGIRLLYFHDEASFTGCLLTAVGGRCWLDWRKGMVRARGARVEDSENRLRWQHYFGQVDLAEARLSFLSNHEDCSGGEIHAVPIAFQPVPGEPCHQFLLGPRLFYLAIDELCFQDDPRSQAIQRASIEAHLEVLERGTEDLLSRLRTIDPNTDMTAFQRLKAEIGVQHDQRDQIRRYLETLGKAGKEDANRWEERASRHLIIIHSAQLQWHPALRDAVWIFIDQQIQQYRQAYSLTYNALRMVQQACQEAANQDADAKRRPRVFSQSPIQMESASQFVQSLLDSTADIPLDHHASSAWIAEREVTIQSEKYMDLHSPQDLARECNLNLPQCLTVQFYTPQLTMLGMTIEREPAAITLVARQATIDTAPLWTGDGLQVMGRRTKIVLGQAELFASRKADLEARHGAGTFIASNCF